MSLNNIQMINVEKIFPHPDNPRKDLGDLGELAVSIRERGIMQNLTVVPFKSKTNPNFNGTGYYTVIIGHRRLEAAKKAGLAEVPCVISNMDEATQLATMMLENMQRNDLTYYEQAQGFKAMLDFGMPIKEIARKTGFSDKTINSRVKLCEFDEKTFKETLDRGASLSDYAKLYDIENEKERNRVLKSIGTANFLNDLKHALNRQEENKKLDVIEQKLKDLGLKPCHTADNLYFVTSFRTYCNNSYAGLGSKHVYERTAYGITVYSTEKPEEKSRLSPEEAERSAKREKRRALLNELKERTYELRQEFIKNYGAAMKNAKIIEAWLIDSAIRGNYIEADLECILKQCGMPIPEDIESDEDYDAVSTSVIDFPDKRALAMLVIAYEAAEDSQYHNCYDYCNVRFERNSKLERIYKWLCLLGYEMSDDEKKMLDGTHEYYGDDI